MSNFIDPAIARKSRYVDAALIDGNGGIPLPSVVEISESGTCNRSCSFCPRSKPDFPDIKEFIKPELIEKLTLQLGEIGFKGIFLFSGFVEPLVDKNIFDLIRIVRTNIPDTRIEMVTNGDALNPDRLKRLFENGLSTLLISVYDGQDDAVRLEGMCHDVGLREDQFVIRHRYLSEDEQFGITLSNRAGMMDDADYEISSLKEPLKAACYYPHYTFFMDYLGDVLLCPHDWGKKRILGNLNEQDFSEIWEGQTAMAARQRLFNKDRAFSPCNQCDVKGVLMGEKHAAAWKSLDQFTTSTKA